MCSCFTLCSASKCHNGQEKSGAKNISELSLSWTLTVLPQGAVGPNVHSTRERQLARKEIEGPSSKPRSAPQILRDSLEWGSHEDHLAPQVHNNERKAQLGLERWLDN